MMVIFGILGICGLFLLLPSSRSARIQKAQARLDNEYKGPTAAEMQPLLKTDLISRGAFYRMVPNEECAVFVFAPTPKDMSSSQYMNEIDDSNTYYPGQKAVRSVILLAPDSGSFGWSLFAKSWIAKVIQNKPTTDMKSLGQELSYSATAAVLKRLKTIWAGTPPDIQKQAEEILERNRSIAKPYGGSRQFYLDPTGKTYEITSSSNLYMFRNDYYEAFPNRQAAR